MRQPLWEVKFPEFIARKRKEPFDWGSNNCITFLDEGIEALTGEKKLEQFVTIEPGLNEEDGKKRAAKLIKKALKKSNCKDPIHICDHIFERRTDGRFFRGDIIATQEHIAEPMLNYAFGFVIDERGVFASPKGLVFLNISSEFKCWRVD